ncbi:aldo/keto reductase [Streptomyces sp. NPDC056672]|uniref:aldo/keto reductase n=1 Tax=Streptomyces sp. NPDC056672 TaxID=3345906 RepID=UPI0036CBD413
MVKLNRLGRSGLFVSQISLGTMNFGSSGPGACTTGEASRIVGRFLEAGGNLIDTADIYTAGESEKILGQVLKGRRDSVLLATKGGLGAGTDPNARGLSRRHLTRALEASLRRLGTDHVDLYQCHVWDAHTPVDETMATLESFVRAGKVRYLGCSNFTAAQIVQAQWAADRARSTPFVALQAQYSLVARSVEAEILPVCRDLGLGTLAWSPLGGGLLAGRYRRGTAPDADSRVSRTKESSRAAAAWAKAVLDPVNLDIAEALRTIAGELGVDSATVALSWLLTNSSVTSVVIGPRHVDQLTGNLRASEFELPPAVIARLNDISAATTVKPVTGRGLLTTGR